MGIIYGHHAVLTASCLTFCLLVVAAVTTRTRRSRFAECQMTTAVAQISSRRTLQFLQLRLLPLTLRRPHLHNHKPPHPPPLHRTRSTRTGRRHGVRHRRGAGERRYGREKGGGEREGGNYFINFFLESIFHAASRPLVPPQMADTIDINFQSDLMAIFEENLF